MSHLKNMLVATPGKLLSAFRRKSLSATATALLTGAGGDEDSQQQSSSSLSTTTTAITDAPVALDTVMVAEPHNFAIVLTRDRRLLIWSLLTHTCVLKTFVQALEDPLENSITDGKKRSR